MVADMFTKNLKCIKSVRMGKLARMWYGSEALVEESDRVVGTWWFWKGSISSIQTSRCVSQKLSLPGNIEGHTDFRPEIQVQGKR